MNNYINLKENEDYRELKKAAQIIKQGGIVIFPTETVYGIGTSGINKKAIEKLYKIKKRDFNKPISLLVSDFDMIEKIAKDITNEEYKIMKKFFPGPLTIILKKKDIVPDILTSNKNTVGVRMPDDIITQKLIEYVGYPIAATSANISGDESGTDFKKIREEFSKKVDFFINGGNSKIGISSTVVELKDGNINILRKGSIKKESIEEVITSKE